MKARIATIISVAGVLVAGTAAATVNTTILDGGTPSGAASQAVLPPAATVDVTIPPTSPPTSSPSTSSTSLPTTSLPSSTTPTPSSTVPSGSTSGGSSLTGMLTAFTVGEAGVVTVDVVSGQVVFVSATPNAGWTVTETDQDDADDDDSGDVEVTFASNTTIVEFEVDLVNGQLVPRVESKSIPTSAGSGSGNATTSTTIDDHDDDDDDEDHDEDHDDEDHDDEDHDDDSGHGGGDDD